MRLALVGKGPAYLLQTPAAAGPGEAALIAEVWLWKDGEDLTSAYAYDAEVTGERVYSVEAKGLDVQRLTAPRRATDLSAAPLPGFSGDLERGYEAATGDSFMSNVTFKVRRVIRPADLDRKPSACPWTVFGNSQELFALETQPLNIRQPQLLAVRVRNTNLSQRQAGQIKAGICAKPIQLDAKPLAKGGIYSVGTSLGGAISALQLEVLERLPFNAPPPRS